MKAFFTSRPFLMIEFFVLCIFVPGLIIYNTWAPMMFVFLWSAAVYGFFIMRGFYFKRIRDMWNWSAVTWENMKPLLLRFVLATIGMMVFLYLYDPDRMFFLAKTRPEFVPVLLAAYPVFSALPQELIFCTFFFARYAPFFGNGKLMIAASAIIFAYAHILYINPVAPTLSLLGGLIFALTYQKTKSLALVTIEHGLYGNALFVIGLGWYFYGGAVGQH